MAFPYIPSGGLIVTAFQQFRRSFPAKVDAATLKKLGIASGNEAAIINILKHLGLVGAENQRTPQGAVLFALHEDAKFADALSKLVKAAYEPLFELHNEGAWTLERDSLISFFRGTDQTSAVTGARQALTFQSLASLSGKREEQIASRSSYGPRNAGSPRVQVAKKERSAPKASVNPASIGAAQSESSKPPVGLTVRIEINLPANGTQSTYDNIFASIRKNLLNDPA